jgi:hypothetical protein
MTSTFAEIMAAIEDKEKDFVTTYVDSATPEGHFKALFDMDGDKLTYLFEGVKNDPNALVKGYMYIMYYSEGVVEEIHAFAQDKVTGKVVDLGALPKTENIKSTAESMKNAFAQMV